MDSRRKDTREARLKEVFADLKRKLQALSTEEWDSMPVIGDYSLRNKKKRFQSFVEKQEGRGTVLSLKLDKLSDSVSGLTITSDAEAKHPHGWIAAARLEIDDVNKSSVLRKGLEHIPDSARLWKAAVEIANEEDARLLLRRAVECCPLHVELWLALAGLETYDNAKRVLNRAGVKLPNEPAIWITAAKLEEAHGNTGRVGKIIERCIRALRRRGLEIDREMWMKEAEAAERDGSVATCQAIITTLSRLIGVEEEEEDRNRSGVADAEECKKRGSADVE